MWVSIASDAACAAALQQAVEAYCIYDTITLKSVLQHDATGFARALCTALRAEAPSRSSTGTVPERIAVADAGSQTTDDMIDVLTAEAIVAEASQVGDELAAKQAVAEHHASQLDCALSKAQAQLSRAEQRAKCENAAKEAAERRAEDWQAAWQAAEQRATDEAASCEAAEERARVCADRLEFGASLLRAAEDRTDRAQAETAGGREIGSC